MKSRIVGVLVFVAVVFAGSSVARASCNVIPSGSGFSPSPPSDSVLLAPFTGPEQFPFKGALGRVDRLYLIPGGTTALATLPDGTCVGQPQERLGVAAINHPDEMIAAILIPRGTTTYASVYASAATCQALSAVLPPAGPAAAGRASVNLLPGCGNAGVKLLPSQSAGTAIVLPVRAGATLAPLANAKGAKDSGVRLVVASKPTTAEALASLLQTAAEESCATKCVDLARAGAMVCVDDIYALTLDTAATTAMAATASWKPDDVPCSLTMPTTINQDGNDFSKGCTDAPSNDTTLPKCSASLSLTELELWRDHCGGIHIPFSWTTIRGGDVTDPKKGVDRVVAAKSGVAVKTQGEGPRIDLPGPEFIGSTPIKDLNAKDPGVNWRNPVIDRWQPSGADEEFGLWGVVDQNDSVVHIYPRLKVNTLCSDNEACFGVHRLVDGSIDGCACSDAYGWGCKCLDDLKPERTKRYFVCEGGDWAGRPCTREDHCGKGGTCTAKPRCRKEGAVWDPSVIPGLATGTECSNDSDCRDNDPNNPQCGYALFDFSTRVDKADGRYTLEAVIDSSSSHDERGVCDDDGKPCSQGNAGKLPKCATGKCIGYSLEAKDDR